MRRSVVHIVKLSFVEHLPWCVDVQVNANGWTGYRIANPLAIDWPMLKKEKDNQLYRE